MKDKKLQVFVSSTFTDLKEERQAAVEQILKSKHIPAGMELFTAGDASQMTIIKKWIDESDVYLLILGGRYGSVEKVSGKSYTHLEFEYAVSVGKPWFAVVLTKNFLNEKVKVLGIDAMEQVSGNAYNDFKAQVMGNLVAECDDLKDIKLAISDKLSEFMDMSHLLGWVRGDNSVNGVLIAEEIAKLSKENEELRKKNESNNSFYHGLSYEELYHLLLSETILFRDRTINAFEFLQAQGDTLVASKVFNSDSTESKLIEILRKYKIVAPFVNRNRFKFTEEGHNFYLKTLALKQSKLVQF